jgi:hypothetical protein
VLLLQVDHLSRQLSRGAADGEEVAAQREGLLGELAAAQQVRAGGVGGGGGTSRIRVEAGWHLRYKCSNPRIALAATSARA